MKKQITFSVLGALSMFCCLSACKTTSKHVAANHQPDTVDRVIYLGYHDTYEKLPKLEFGETDSSVFLNSKRGYQNKISTDSSRITFSDTTFTIKTSRAKLVYPSVAQYARRGTVWAEYKGFSKDLQLYILESWSDGEFTLGDSFYIDKRANVMYSLPSPSDGPFELPVISPDNHFLITWLSNRVGEDFSFIGIIRVERDHSASHYTELASAEMKDLLLMEVVWADDHSIAVKANKPVFDAVSRNWEDHYVYLKTTLLTTNAKTTE